VALFVLVSSYIFDSLIHTLHFSSLNTLLSYPYSLRAAYDSETTPVHILLLWLSAHLQRIDRI